MHTHKLEYWMCLCIDAVDGDGKGTHHLWCTSRDYSSSRHSLLFLCYTNDLPTSITYRISDHTPMTLHYIPSYITVTDCINLQQDLNTLSYWAISYMEHVFHWTLTNVNIWRLLLNKTLCHTITPWTAIANTKIKEVSSTKYPIIIYIVSPLITIWHAWSNHTW